jgi:hypothetical protein
MSALVLILLAATVHRTLPPRPKTPPAEFNAKVQQLAEKLTDENAGVRDKAEQELLAMGPPATEQLLATAALTRDAREKQAIEALLPRYGSEAIERLLWGPGWAVRVYRGDAGTDDPIKDLAVNAIVKMGAAALPEVRRLMDVGLRGAMTALNRLGPVGTETVVDLLLNHPDDEMRTSMASILADAKSPDPQAADGLLKALKSQDTAVHMYVARAVGNLRDRRAIDRLLELLSAKDDPLLRMAAGAALGKMYEPRLFGPLSRRAKWDSVFSVRQTASNVLMYWTYDPVAIRVGRRYYPPRMTEAVVDVAYTRLALLLVATGMLVYVLIWSARAAGQAELWRGLSARVLGAAGLALLLGFAWAFWMIRVWGLIELLLLLVVLPATALLAWRTGARLKSLRGSLVGCAVGVLLVFLGAQSSMWVSLGLEWLAPRLLVLIVALSVLSGVLRTRGIDAALLASTRTASLACAAAFYLGYGVGWLALWGYLGF